MTDTPTAKIPTSGVIVVTGTDTGVGKTVATAAMAATLSCQGIRVHVYKPVQTGLIAADHPRREELQQLNSEVVIQGDAEVAGGLAGCSYSTGASYELPAAPQAAADHAQTPLSPLQEHVDRVTNLLGHHDVVLVEGAGGLLVDLGDHTLADFACQLQEQLNYPVHIVVVVRPNLGTLNHTALTVEVLRHRHLEQFSVLIGAWPGQPTEVEISNYNQLSRTYPVIGRIPHNSGSLSSETFRSTAPKWFGPTEEQHSKAQTMRV